MNKDQAWAVGGGSYVANMKFCEIADRIAKQLADVRDERAGARAPSSQELLELRERYLEHKALSERSDTLWGLVHPKSETASVILLLAYRLTVFTAAVVILWRQFSY